MASSSDKPEQAEQQSTDDTKSGSCPACGDSELQPLSATPHPVCAACGFVTGTGTEIPDPSDDDEVSSGTKESWTEYYSVSNSTEQQVASAIECLERLGDTLLLSPEARSQAAEVYERAARENLTDGRSTELIVAASICIASRETETPRPSDRVAEAADLSSSNVKGAIRLFQEELNRGYTEVSAGDYVPYLCDDIGFDNRIKDRAITLLEELDELDGHTDYHPAGMAGAAIYLVADGDITQRQIASVAGVTKETIRIRLNDLRRI